MVLSNHGDAIGLRVNFLERLAEIFVTEPLPLKLTSSLEVRRRMWQKYNVCKTSASGNPDDRNNRQTAA